MFGSEKQKEGNIQRGHQTRIKLWYKGKDVLINKVFNSTYKRNIEKKTEKISLPL